MPNRLTNCRALITGASDGIGFAIAQAFASEGANVWMVARDSEKLVSAAEHLSNLKSDIRTSSIDLLDQNAIERLAKEVLSQWGSLDILVNNAGMARFTEFAEVSAEEIQQQVQLNLLTPYRLTQLLLPALRANQGNVINISSTSAHRLIPGRPASVYAMTKGGLNSLTKALALELGPQGIRVNAIVPGTVKTSLTKNLLASFSEEKRAYYDKFVEQSFALGRLGEPEDIANLAVYLASEEAKWVTGSLMIVDGGLSTN